MRERGGGGGGGGSGKDRNQKMERTWNAKVREKIENGLNTNVRKKQTDR